MFYKVKKRKSRKVKDKTEVREITKLATAIMNVPLKDIECRANSYV